MASTKLGDTGKTQPGEAGKLIHWTNSPAERRRQGKTEAAEAMLQHRGTGVQGAHPGLASGARMTDAPCVTNARIGVSSA